MQENDAELEHEAVSQLLIEQFVNYRLPALMKMKEEVAEGKCLSDGELELLGRMLKQAHDFARLEHEFPEFQDVIARIIDLYHEITEGALRNEEQAPPAPE